MPESPHVPSVVVSQFLASDSDSNPGQYPVILADLIESKELSLLQFIQVLGPHLTSDSDLIRPRAIQCLAETLKQIQTSTTLKQVLSRQDVGVLLQFLISKFDDSVCLIYVFQTLSTLVQFSTFHRSLLPDLLQAVVDKYNPKSHLAKIRYEPFVLLQQIATKSSCQQDFVDSPSTADLFVSSFIHVATGEKDPRNLLVSFELNAFIASIVTFDQSSPKHEEFLADLFDVAFCYFPISFTPPANDPYKITATDLKSKLRTAIALQPLYAKDSFPSLIEKLTSTNPAVRNDTLKTIQLCIERYDSETVLEYWVTLWDALKFEILHNDVLKFRPEDDTILPINFYSDMDDTDDFKPLYLTLQIVKELGTKLDSATVSPDTKGSALQNMCQTITNELKENLSNVKDKVFKQSVLLVTIVATSTPEAFNLIVDFLFSYSVWGKYLGVSRVEEEEGQVPQENSSKDSDMEIDINNKDKEEDSTLTVAKQRELIDNLGFVLNSYNDIVSIAGQEFVNSNHLILHKDTLLIFMGQLLQASSNLEKTLKAKTTQQLKKLIKLQDFLDSQECTLIFGYFNDILVDTIKDDPKNWERDTVVVEVKEALTDIMSENSNRVPLVIERILPNLLAALSAQENESLSSFTKVLQLIGQLCVNYQFLEILSIRLLNRLSEYSNSGKKEHFIVTVRLLIDAVTKTEMTLQFLTNSWYKNFVPRFLGYVLKLQDENIVELSGDLLALIIKYIDRAQHQIILQDFTGIFLENKSTFVESNSSSTNTSILSQPSVLVNLFDKVLSSLDFKVVTLSSALSGELTVHTLLKQVAGLAENASTSTYVRLGYLQLLALLVNKFTNDKEDVLFIEEEFLAQTYSKLEQESTSTDETFIESFETFIWTIKGLILKSNKIGLEYFTKIVFLLSCPNDHVSKLISKSLAVIMADIPVFTAPVTTTSSLKSISSNKLISGVQCYNVRMLYKQRIFDSALPILLEGFQKAANMQSKESFLVALSSFLSNIPTSVLKPHVEVVAPLILTSFSIRNTIILKSSLETCQIILTDSSEVMSPHLQTLIPSLIKLSTSPDSVNTEEIRRLSLKCLLLTFQNVDANNLVPYHKTTSLKLVKALDDKKRSVRNLARQISYELTK